MNHSQHPLLIPMNVEALVVPTGGTEGAEWVDLRPDFRRIAKNRFLGSDLETDPEVNLRTRFHQPGIHLHWALPDGLTAGTVSSPQSFPEFPNVPNRWLIVRRHDQDPAAGKAWILESDRIDAQGQSMWPRPPEAAAAGDDRDCHLLVGRAFALDGWAEDPNAPRIDDLTATGYGDPAFAAYYPASNGLFGFHDAQARDVADGALTYSVVGWYADSAKDPLYQTSSDSKGADDRVERFLSDKRWTYEAAKNEPRPDGLICHGAVSGVFWTGGDALFDSGVPAGGDFAIAAGQTFAEAFTALFDDRVKDAIEALQYDLLGEFDDAEDDVIDSKVHENTFAPVFCGIAWSVRPSGAQPLDGPSAQPVPIPGHVRTLVERLNRTQTGINQLERERESLRSELYACWYKDVARAVQTGAANPALRQHAVRLRKEIDDTGSRIDALAGASAEQRARLADQLDRFLPGHELQQTNEARFWKPNDPVLLFTGPAIQRSRRHGEDGRYRADGALFCRLGSQVVTGVTLSIAHRRREVVFEKERIDGWCREHAGATRPGVPAVAADLLRETLLLTLDSRRAREVATAAYDMNLAGLAAGQPQGVHDFAHFILAGLAAIWKGIEAVRELDAEPLPRHASAETEPSLGTGIAFGGRFPSPLAINRWRGNPWIPLHLHWRVDWHASPAPGQEEALAQWLSGRDFAYPPPASDAETFSGTTLLTPGATAHLASRLRHYRDRGGCDDALLTRLIVSVGSMNLLCQSLGGLNEQFLSRKSRLEMAPLTPGSGDHGPSRFTDYDRDFEAIDWRGPLVDGGFSPFRAGLLELKCLWIIDAFGQVLKLDERNPDALRRPIPRTPPPPNVEPRHIALAPRLAQPARLAVEWLAAENHVREAATWPWNIRGGSPVCGWILPNLLDAGLMIYDAAGHAHGMLQAVKKASWERGVGGAYPEIESFHWMDLPGSKDFFFGKPPAQLAGEHPLGASADPDLSGFIKGLLALALTSGRTFGGLLEQLDQRASAPGGAGHGRNANLALLIGRPFCLVRARLRLDLYGRAALDWRGRELSGDTGGVESLRFPLRLEGGGLVGFFVKRDYSRFYPAFDIPPPAGATADDHYHAFRRLPTLSVNEPLDVTLLMDPTQPFFATTGILPRKSIRLPYDDVAEVLEHKEVIFFTGPLVGPGDSMRMPQPSDLYGQWSWNHHPQVNLWAKDQTITDFQREAAGFPRPPLQVSEGWLKLITAPLDVRQLRVKGVEPMPGPTTGGDGEPPRFSVPAGQVVLAWSVAGAESIELRAAGEPLFRSNQQPLPLQFRLYVARNTVVTVMATDREKRSASTSIELVVRADRDANHAG